MGNYLADLQKRERIQKNTLHPIWYGIGCLMLILTPIISWAASAVTLDYGISHKWPYIGSLTGVITFPGFIYNLPVIGAASRYISSIPYLEGYIIFFVLFVLLFSGLFAVLNAVLYRMFGPPRYSEIDAPPEPKRKMKKQR